jgi:RHH-type transcriptional regulator, proline utilization regulon repressor / proline dehydrogenase / delta 1-pyrroline-5-carboxylate dehydrogenase
LPGASPDPDPDRVTAARLRPEGPALRDLLAEAALDAPARARISARAGALVDIIRARARPGLMETFLAEYGLSTDEGIALMCLAEALLRVPDAATIDALIEDKIAPSDWGRHLGASASPLVNASTWALMLTGRVLDDDRPGMAGVLRGAVRRLGEPVIRTAVARAMRELGRQFVLGEDIAAAMTRARGAEASGYTHSYDMLGEAARTHADADRYFRRYARAIAAIAPACRSPDMAANPGISVKLSALHPRYEEAKRARMLAELAPRLAELARAAAAANMGLNIDAEESERLELSLDVMEAVARDPALDGWAGFGAVVQAYGPRAGPVIDRLYDIAGQTGRRMTLRLVKGAYWDTEIKRAQMLGIDGFPVFTRKPATDLSWIALARRLLGMTDRIYPQFATHNAHSAAAVLEMAGGDRQTWEFQRLHGMGAALHAALREQEATRCRIYAPVGAHRDLLAYLVRRLLENGANSSFVNQLLDARVPAAQIAACPLAAVEAVLDAPGNPILKRPADLFRPDRANARGWDIAARDDIAEIAAARGPFAQTRFAAAPVLAGDAPGGGTTAQVENPARPGEIVGEVTEASEAEVDAALSAARAWAVPGADRAAVLRRAADLFEADFGAFLALAAREAGKSWTDAVGELREACDFLRYYAARATEVTHPGGRVLACISPWNFPLAIFTGQVAGALAAGNAVIAKPAEQTPLIAARAVALLHEAGVPRAALQFLPGDGARVGGALTADPRLGGVVFTGGTETARIIDRAMAAHLDPGAPLVAETGGINAMVVDSTALPEQAVRDIIASAFQSAGQRCSALRCLYVQDDVADTLIEMLTGAMDALTLGDPWDIATDIGPAIDAAAAADIRGHVDAARQAGRLIHALDAPPGGHFVGPAVIAVDGIAAIPREVFGPVLHLARFRASDLDRVIAEINATGYGLTFGLHSRIDDRVQRVVDRVRAGNLYVNRNQIGAIVGSQPFGGEGLSGTGPKAGGPHYVARLAVAGPCGAGADAGPAAPVAAVAAALAALPRAGAPILRADLPGPTGESNRLATLPRGIVLCLGPGLAAAQAQADAARATGNAALCVCPGGDVPGVLDPAALTVLDGFDAVFWQGGAGHGRALRRALAARDGPILPLWTSPEMPRLQPVERHVCIDTTAAGGNAALLAATGAG